MNKNYKVTALYLDGESSHWVNAKNEPEARLVWGLTYNDPERKLVKLSVEKI